LKHRQTHAARDAGSSKNRNKRLVRQLAAYSAAACAGALVANEASAEVRNLRLPGGSPIVITPDDEHDLERFDLDIDRDGVLDFQLTSYLGDVYIRSLSNPLSLSGIVLREYFSFTALSVGAGEWIDQYLGFNHDGFNLYATLDDFIGTRGYAGVRFDIPGGSRHYGYLDIGVSASGSQITLYGGAYETLIEGGIQAGATPEPTTLGLLALGAAGVAAWRTRRRSSL
jgi:hypothetical protein